MNFAGKTAVVTGGSRGIGRAICEELARGGANVVLCYAGRAEAAQETVTACEDLGAKALAVQCNVADEAQVKALMDAAVKEFGRHRHSGEQCRRHPGRPCDDDEGGRLRRGDRHEPERHLPVHEGRVPNHDEAAVRPDREPL